MAKRPNIGSIYTAATLLTCALIACSEEPSAGPGAPPEDISSADVTPQDTGAVEDSAAPGDVATPEDLTDGIEEAPEAEPGCDCQMWQFCDEDGQTCQEDVCEQGLTTCHSVEELKICADDGSGFEVIPCSEGRVCQAGQCIPTVCSPDDPPTCEGGAQKVCNSLGTDWTLLPCPGGSACLDGACQPVEPNVLLIMDTSGSMHWMNDEGALPSSCDGDTCPPWTWPACDAPDDPQTRLGKAKKGLQGVLESEAADKVRLALQRFPQKFDLLKLLGNSAPTCDGAPMWGFDLASMDNGTKHGWDELSPEQAVDFLVVPFSEDEQSTTAEILSWVDFEHTVVETGVPCANLNNCENPIAGKTCIDGQCAEFDSPELRAMGKTPLGRALFYGGEVFRHLVVKEGQPCAEDADCGSPHYSCVDGACHDPLRACRANQIIVFSDGGETNDTETDDFFHPSIQAKRLHHGLGCSDDADCLNGATCSNGACSVPVEALPAPTYLVVPSDKCWKGEVVDGALCDVAPGADEVCCKTAGVCHLTDVPCANNDPCFDAFPYPCGGTASTCSGKCEYLGLDFTDDKGANLLLDAAGNPISITVHVVDASPSPTGASLVAALGGGQHVPVDLDNLDGLLEGFLPLLDVKSNLDGCGD